MSSNRLKIMLSVAGVLLALVIWHWISGWGLVTIHAQSEPLSKIISSIERQGGIKIITNADPTTPIIMDVDRVPPAQAVDVLAAWMDGNWSVGYAAGPTKADVLAGIAALQEDRGGRDSDFARYGFGGFGGFGGGGGGMEGTDTVIDARRVVWKVSPSDDKQLQSYLGQLSFKTGLAAIVPRSWNPAVAETPKGGASASALRELVRSAKGELQEIFVIRVQKDDPTRTAGNDGGDRGPRTEGGFGGGRGNFNQDWIADRTEARIAALPASEQEQARKDSDSMRDMFEKMRALPEADRRAAFEKLMNDPDFQEKMLVRQMTRDAKRSPEKRAERFRQYLQNKEKVKASAQ
jgi:hypothetical protein